MKGLMVDDNRGGHRVTFNDICAIPVPQATQSYTPVANGDLVRLIKDRIDTVLDMGIRSEGYALSGKDQQMFGVITLDTGMDTKDTGMSIGFCNSYDRSLVVKMASGANVFVCSNLCFSGDSMRVLRKHTLNVWRDVQATINTALGESHYYHKRLELEVSCWKEQAVEQDEGYETIGRAMGHGILMPQQATVALKDWKNARHEAFEPRSAWSLYNCFTEGLKKGRAGLALGRHTVAHDWFREQYNTSEAVVAGQMLEDMSNDADEQPARTYLHRVN